MGVQEMDAMEMVKTDGGLCIRFEGSTKDIYNSANPPGERWFWQRNY